MTGASRASGTLYVVGTPIGNLEDLSDRVRRVLGEVDRVAAEDTRTTGLLLKRLGISTRLVSLFEGNEHARVAGLLEELQAGQDIAVVSECGTPGISDPGATLVEACLGAGIPVVPIPGPSAVTSVLSVCGLDVARFRFEGFLPRKGAERRRRVEWLQRDPVTAVLFESPNRLARTLQELAETLGLRRAVVAREVTKLHEQFVRGTLPELAARFSEAPPRGEVTLVVEGARESDAAMSEEEVERIVLERLASGERARDIARDLADLTGRSRRDLYALVNQLKS